MFEHIAPTVSALLDGVTVWRDRRTLLAAKRENGLQAVNKVMRAVVATKAYLYDDLELSQASRERETEISAAWYAAAEAIYAFDRNLFESAQLKSLGWADPREWERANTEALTVDLNMIMAQCRWIRESLDRET